MTNYKTLEAWKKSMLLVKDIYLLTKAFPKDELYTLTSQIRRAAISIPSNIAEGSGRKHKKETIQFLHISRGSLYEVDTQLNIAILTNILTEEKFKPVSEQTEECIKILNGLITYYEKNDLN